MCPKYAQGLFSENRPVDSDVVFASLCSSDFHLEAMIISFFHVTLSYHPTQQCYFQGNPIIQTSPLLSEEEVAFENVPPYDTFGRGMDAYLRGAQSPPDDIADPTTASTGSQSAT